MKFIQNLCLHLFLSLFFLSFPLPSHQQSTRNFANPRLRNAYIALHAWKKTFRSDPSNFTGNWKGWNVCKYKGIYCAPALDDSYITTVAGIDLNHANIAGTLPKELGLLTDIAVFHLNSNRFTGTFPYTLKNWRLLFELDISNNRFNCEFPDVFLSLPSLKFIDLRFNYFTGHLPSKLFDLKLDAIFINNNKFTSNFPRNIANSPASVVNLAHNTLPGCIPRSIWKMGKTLNEIILMDVGLKACLPTEVGRLGQVNVFDVSKNRLSGSMPHSMGNMKNLEELNVANNMLSGNVPAVICRLPKLQNFTYSNNFFTGEPGKCSANKNKVARMNCIQQRPFQRPSQQCRSVLSYPVHCSRVSC